MKVESVEHRARYSVKIFMYRLRRAGAFTGRMTEKTAGAGIHSGHQSKFARIGKRARHTGNGDLSVL